MNKTYIQFDSPKSDSKYSKEGLVQSWLKKIFVSVLTMFIPKANPDFDDKIDQVKYWLLECDIETGIPEREMGLDEQGKVILKMPLNKNFGYWIDNNLLLKDFKRHFVVSEISKDSFDEKWELFDKISNFEIEISDFKIQSTGADGGHIYLLTEIDYKGKKRKLIVYFNDKSDEQKVKAESEIKLSGQLFDEGENQYLSLYVAKLIQ